MTTSDDAHAVTIEPLAVSINEAARIVGLSRSQFYVLFLKSGLIKPAPHGGRRRLIDVGELRAVYQRMMDEGRGHE